MHPLVVTWRRLSRSGRRLVKSTCSPRRTGRRAGSTSHWYFPTFVERALRTSWRTAIDIVAPQTGFVSPVNFRIFFLGFCRNRRILFTQPDPNSFIISFVCSSDRLLRRKFPLLQILSHSLQCQIHRILLFDQQLNSPPCPKREV